MICSLDAWSVVHLHNHVCQLAGIDFTHHYIIQESKLDVLDHLASGSLLNVLSRLLRLDVLGVGRGRG